MPTGVDNAPHGLPSKLRHPQAMLKLLHWANLTF